jgi:tetratricopeptide (TPR) repeat protein
MKDIRFVYLGMERLHQLLHSLTKQQVKVLRSYLTSFSTRDPNTKFWELADYILKDKTIIPELKKVSVKIYGELPDGRIQQLKNRLYYKVLDSLLFDINTVRANYDDELHPIQVKLRKKMILYDLLKHTDLRQTVGFELIDDIIATAKQNEFYAILMDALYIKKWNYGLRKGVSFFQNMNEEIAFYEKCKAAVQRANDLGIELGNYSTFNPKAGKAKLQDFIKDGIDELKQLYIATNTKTLWYTLRTFEVAYLQHQKEHTQARDLALEVITKMKGNKVVGRAVRFGVWYSYLAQFETELGNYDEALLGLEKAKVYFNNNQLNLSVNKKQQLDIRFLQGHYTQALVLANELSQTNTKVTGDFRRDMFLYYKACCHFMLGEFREAVRLLGQKFQITRDKLGWEVNIRFMRIMSMVELQKPDEAFTMVQSLQKHMERYKQLQGLSERDRMLLNVFRELGKEGFAFIRPADKVYRMVLLLMEKGKSHSWEPLSPELIQVHNWIIRRYQHFLPPKSVAEEEKEIVKPRPRKKAKGNA